MLNKNYYLITVFSVLVLITGCASPSLPMTNEEIQDAQIVELQPDEAIVAVQLVYTSPAVAGGQLNFHHDGKEEIMGKNFVRGLESWSPMFSIPTSMSGKPLLFKVKAGRLSFTQFNRGMYIGNLKNQLSAYASAKTITYIGDINLRIHDSPTTRFSYVVLESALTLQTLRIQYPDLFIKYPQQTYLLKPGL